jgi:hypothetical protein
MTRSFLILGALVASLALAPLCGVADAEAGDREVRFFVVDWRLTWEEGTKGLRLQLKGRTRSSDNDLGDEFSLVSTKVEPILEILRTCAMGRLTGTATVEGNSSEALVGQKITSLTCRAILK